MTGGLGDALHLYTRTGDADWGLGWVLTRSTLGEVGGLYYYIIIRFRLKTTVLLLSLLGDKSQPERPIGKIDVDPGIESSLLCRAGYLLQ